MILIREIAEDDASAVAAIIVSSLGYATDEQIVRANIRALAHDDHYLTLVWEEGDAVLGFIHAMRYDTLHRTGGWDVISLAVAPEAQGRGIGSALLKVCEARARERGGAYVRLNSRIEREDAHLFYEHRGYICDKQQKRFIKQLDAEAGGCECESAQSVA